MSSNLGCLEMTDELASSNVQCIYSLCYNYCLVVFLEIIQLSLCSICLVVRTEQVKVGEQE